MIDASKTEREHDYNIQVNEDVDRSIVLSLAASYLVRLDNRNRQEFLKKIDSTLKQMIASADGSGKSYLETQLDRYAHSCPDTLLHMFIILSGHKMSWNRLKICYQSECPFLQQI